MDKLLLLEMYRMMVRIREFENEAIELAKTNETRAAVHTYQGQEAIAAGVCAHMTKDDYITSTHRGHGHCIAKGADLTKMFAELLGKKDGYCKGKGGSMHIADLATGNLGANGIVGGGIPISVGAGLSMQLSKSDNFTVCFFGDGASNEGSFHESLNLASIWDLPVIFICENNHYGISTCVKTSMNVEDIADRAIGYNIRGMIVDGNDIIDVYNSTKEAIEHVKSGKGPVLMEMKTYRIAGHYFGDNENYRSRAEVREWRGRDPIKRCAELLEDKYSVLDDEFKIIRKEEKLKVLSASSAAKLMKEPSPDDLFKDLFDPTMAEIKWIPFLKSEGE